MEQRVVINLGKGNWQKGFPNIIVQLRGTDETEAMQLIGQLPKAPALFMLFERWQSYYYAINSDLGLRQLQSVITFEKNPVTHVSDEGFKALCQQLKKQFNAWLSVTTFMNVDRRLRTHLDTSKEVQLIIEAEDSSVRRFPWHLWQFLDDFRQAEIAIGSLEHRQVKRPPRAPNSPVRLLSILGNDSGIKLSTDIDILEKVPNVEMTLLEKPPRSELNEQLWRKQGWEILFFAGHSFSQQQDSIGKIQLNDVENLSISQIRHGVEKAISQGLQLAIFNSCDGMGLARELADLHIPYLIVMREPVSDQVAQLFLMNFIRAFSTGTSFYLAMREARERLQGIENLFPCASWLPVIFQNSTAATLTWEDLQGSNSQTLTKIKHTSSHNTIVEDVRVKKLPLVQCLAMTAITSLLITGLILGTRTLGVFQPVELPVYDQMMRFQPVERTPDHRLFIVGISNSDIKYQQEQGWSRRWSLSDEALEALLLELDKYQPAAIGIDITRDAPADPETTELIQRIKSDDRIYGICYTDAYGSLSETEPAPELPPARQTLSNLLEGRNGVIRRQLISADPRPESACDAQYSFSARLALEYLDQKKQLHLEFPDNETLLLGQSELKRLKKGEGGYQENQISGFQTLFKYRPYKNLENIAPIFSLEDILEGRVNIDDLRDRIVLVGTLYVDGKDLWVTPFSQDDSFNEKTPGVMVHAQMISHLLDVGEGKENRTVKIWSWSKELTWIWIWSFSGGMALMNLTTQTIRRMILFATILIGLYLICYAYFINGYWLPLVPALLGIAATFLVSQYFFKSFLSKPFF
ncbi:MAG: CHASE2 domain-containing protein [Cyanobacteria bacterium J06560_6]